MEKGKVVSLEDRVPKLKEHRKQKSNRRLILFLSVFFILILLVIYFQSPLSKVSSVDVAGNKTVSEEEIINMSGITEKSGFWSINEKEVNDALSDFEQIQNVKLDKHLPNKVTIVVEEYYKVAYIVKGDQYSPILENGKTLDPVEGTFPDDAPLLINWSKAEEIEEMAMELMSLPDSVKNAISEIYHTPEKTDPWHITLYMNDGFEVQASVRSFSKKMIDYPAIVSQLAPNSKGIIHMEVGTYFESYDKKDEAAEEAAEEGAASEAEPEGTVQNENEDER
ncbi:cell division protein FtsQ/DivIB [Peribacillus frigoritolerans]|uniref:cell division protein FtsQ/DivIB n=1 Tax=Peribacillus frigoritolerans TaxID=450367 RepID=UPI001059FA74|nr:cell division protein FtsQ/DivIB [Peribacillus frigoritolerans]TDL79962.1 cell division protein FtsQ/DivIB [Peribacillus frigoritolerans]